MDTPYAPAEGKGRKTPHLFVLAVWTGLGAFLAIHSWGRLGVGQIRSPGPGFMPFLLGVLFFLAAAVTFAREVSPRRQGEGERKEALPSNLGKIAAVLVTLLAYGVLLERLGYVVTTFPVLAVLFFAAGVRRWAVAAGSSLALTVLTYLLFGYLGVLLPSGILPALSFG
ncbi:MAG: tripartite tricarboxylate transporter TctB family protein [Deltaproteobacteria bacterium]|nr:tripartite tricarboxylate transporter TctB family protein [Deltaproteobacteria bacterium]